MRGTCSTKRSQLKKELATYGKFYPYLNHLASNNHNELSAENIEIAQVVVIPACHKSSAPFC